MKEFRTGCSRVLITTDLLARGYNFVNLQVSIFNKCTWLSIMTFPSAKKNIFTESEDLDVSEEKVQFYIETQGVAINFVMPGDYKFVKEIEKFYNTQIEEMPLDVTELLS